MNERSNIRERSVMFFEIYGIKVRRFLTPDSLLIRLSILSFFLRSTIDNSSHIRNSTYRRRTRIGRVEKNGPAWLLGRSQTVIWGNLPGSCYSWRRVITVMGDSLRGLPSFFFRTSSSISLSNSVSEFVRLNRSNGIRDARKWQKSGFRKDRSIDRMTLETLNFYFHSSMNPILTREPISRSFGVNGWVLIEKKDRII